MSEEVHGSEGRNNQENAWRVLWKLELHEASGAAPFL
jgi:hypothetical protein